MGCYKHDSNETIELGPGDEVFLNKRPASRQHSAFACVWIRSRCKSRHQSLPDSDVLDRLPRELTQVAKLRDTRPRRKIFRCQGVCRDTSGGREVLFARTVRGASVRIVRARRQPVCS